MPSRVILSCAQSCRCSNIMPFVPGNRRHETVLQLRKRLVTQSRDWNQRASITPKPGPVSRFPHRCRPAPAASSLSGFSNAGQSRSRSEIEHHGPHRKTLNKAAKGPFLSVVATPSQSRHSKSPTTLRCSILSRARRHLLDTVPDRRQDIDRLAHPSARRTRPRRLHRADL